MGLGMVDQRFAAGIYTCLDSRGQVTSPKGGRDPVLDDLCGELVSYDRLQPAAHFDADLALVRCNKE